MSCQVLSELDLRFPGTIEKVEAVHVFLRNRNYCTPYPGYITEVFPKLAAQGDKRIAQKVGEEAVEVAIAAVQGDKGRTVSEAADLLYHLIVLLEDNELSLADLATELAARHRK